LSGFGCQALALYATQGLSNKVISAIMFSASKLARSGKGPIALRPQYLALILILVAPGPSRSQEAAASGLKGTVHSALTEDFGNENCGSDKPLGSLYEIYDAQGYVIKASVEGFGSQAYSREQRYRVIVWPAGPEGTPKPDRYDMNIEGRSDSYTREADGGYVIPGIPPGHYRLVSVAWSGAEYLGEGDTRFDVTDADVTLHLTVGGLGEIQGVVKPDDAQARVPTGVMIGIESQEGAAQGSDVDTGGRFMFGRVLPGGYEFNLLKKPAGIVLRRVRCGGVEVTPDTPLRVTHGPLRGPQRRMKMGSRWRSVSGAALATEADSLWCCRARLRVWLGR
jgi:hypothetical protein